VLLRDRVSQLLRSLLAEHDTSVIVGFCFHFKDVSTGALVDVHVTTTSQVVTTTTTTTSRHTVKIADGTVRTLKVTESKATLLNTHKSVVASHPSR
jgi:hypothetical protein